MFIYFLRAGCVLQLLYDDMLRKMSCACELSHVITQRGVCTGKGLER